MIATLTTDAVAAVCQDWRNRKIPRTKSRGTALDYHQVPIAINGRANQEPLVDLRALGVACSSAYARADAPYYRSFASALPTVYARTTVAEKLQAVNATLAHSNVELLAWDGFRSIALQRELWDHFIEQGRQVLVSPTDDELVGFAGRFCSDPRHFDPDNPATWPVHNTGGAIDLTLRRIDDGQQLFMGSVFDDAHSISSTRYFERRRRDSQSDVEAMRNRRLLYHAMVGQGFSNYSHEWWHFTFGTQMCVMNGAMKEPALYGRATLR